MLGTAGERRSDFNAGHSGVFNSLYRGLIHFLASLDQHLIRKRVDDFFDGVTSQDAFA